MPASKFANALSGEDEIQITITRLKDGKDHTLPIWFAVQAGRLELLPMYGLKALWFRDLEKSGSMSIKVKDESMKATPRIIRDEKTVEEVKERFGAKYGRSDVKKYYPTSEVALEISLE